MNPEPRTSEQWAAWLDAEEKRSLQLYTDYPERLVSDSNQERQVARDYAGREILELLQNANDAAIDAGMRGRVRIELSAAGLIVANEGAPFTRDGVASLKLANFSPKRTRKRQMVGNKGLGFRAVLNWTRTPLVLSEGLALAFSAAAAHYRQQRLARTSEKLRTLIAEEQKTSGVLIVPLLTFPGFRENGEVAALLDDDAQRTLHTRAIELRAQGFTTVIAMPFDGSETQLAEARQQLAQLRPEVLLFARSIAALEIAESGKPQVCWRHDSEDPEGSRVHISDTEVRVWRIFRLSGAVPDKLCPADRPGGMDYEVTVAVPENHEAKEGLLYSYFPTEMSFPYPMVVHATLDLQANRQQAQDTKANHFIFGRLARCMAETAQTLAQESDNDRGLVLLSARSPSAPLEKFHFRKRLRRLARQCVLVPTAAAGLVKARSARRTNFSDNAWLPSRHFPSLARVGSDSAAGVLAWLDVTELGSADWIELTLRLEFDSIAERADYVAGLVRHKVTDAMESGRLLLDSNGQPILPGHKVFVGTTTQSSAGLPVWFESRFLHEELRMALQDRLKLPRQDALIVELAPLNVATYSLSSVIESLLAQARQRAKDDPSQEELVRREVVGALYTLFSSNDPAEKRPQFPAKAQVSLRTSTGSSQDARKLYLSSAYGARGRILEDLFSTFAPEKLLAPPEAHGLSSVGETFVEFFRWLGVADAPREVRLEKAAVEDEFTSYVQRNLPKGTFVIGGYQFARATAFKGFCTGVLTLDDLPRVLSQAPLAAVLAWLATDGRAPNWKSLLPEHGKLCYEPGYGANTREHTAGIPSYIRWKLRSTAWLPTRGGTLTCPQDCLMEPLPGLSKLLPTPAHLRPEEWQRYGLNPSFLFTALDHAGAMPGFSQMEPSRLYELLQTLPESDPEGESARAFYDAALRYFSEADVRECEDRKRFFAKGRIFARRGSEQGYRSVGEVWRLDANDLPPALRQRLYVATIREKAAAERVRAVLGVQSVKQGQIARKILHWTLAPAAAEAQAAIEQLKPLIGLLRPTNRGMGAFGKLQLCLCTEVAGEVIFADEAVPLELGDWDWVLDDAKEVAFLCIQPGEMEPLASPMFAHAVGEIFARIFDLESGAEFAQLAGCRNLSERLALLQRLHGDEPIPGWEELLRSMHERRAKGQEFMLPAEALSPRAVLPATPAQPSTLTPPPAGPSDSAIVSEPLQIKPQPHVPTPARVIELRVARTVRAGVEGSTSYERMTGDFCEEKVMEFERAEGRFPLYVGGVTGRTGPKVDVVSFNTEDERAAFEVAERKDATMVARFIEVKGRRDGGAKIDLRGNELDAALNYAERYYIYRVTDVGIGRYALAMLCDPLSAPGAAKRFYQVDLSSAATTERVDLIGGCDEASYFLEREATVGSSGDRVGY